MLWAGAARSRCTHIKQLTHRNRTITQGVRRDGSKLKPPMAFFLYATMTEQDLGAIVAYLRTVPPLE
jgi:hypothetical protein